MNTGNGAPGADGGCGRNSFLRVEKSLLGECSAREQAELEAEMAADPALRAYYEEAKSRKSDLTWEKLQARLAAEPSARPAPDRAAAARPDPGFLEGLLGRLEGLFPNPRVAMAWGGSLVLVALVLPITWMAQEGDGLRAKGNLKAEVALEVDGARVAPEGRAAAKPGSILTFAYKSPAPLSAQIWYVEDSGAPSRFDGKDEPSLAWKASPEWGRAPQQIELEGAWKTQRVTVVVSGKALPPGEVSAWVSGAAKPAPGVSVFNFNLEQK